MANDHSDISIKEARFWKYKDIAYWFFRFNGCLMIENFNVHPDFHKKKDGLCTDIDILAMRFPFRRELFTSGPEKYMKDYAELFPIDNRLIDVMFVELKRRRCELNDSWTNPGKGTLKKFIYAIGIFNDKETIDAATENLYKHGIYENGNYRVRFVAVAEKTDEYFQYKNVKQLTWDELLGFIYERLWGFQDVKHDHIEWDDTGNRLYEFAKESLNKHSFIESIKASSDIL